jgi:hypothetical protein
MISIDNTVELMVKVYLSLPKKITGLSISRKQYQEFAESCPLLLDATETHVSYKIVGVNILAKSNGIIGGAASSVTRVMVRRLSAKEWRCMPSSPISSL